MTKWEYKKVQLTNPLTQMFDERLAELGEQGWEAYAVCPHPSFVNDACVIVCFKRPYEDPVVCAGNAKVLGLLQPA